MTRVTLALLALCSMFLMSCGSQRAAPGRSVDGPIGWDIFRHLNQLPEIPVGVHEDEVSSYDRAGGNNDGFLGTYSCLSVGPEGCVIAQHSGPGEIDSIWFTRDGGNVRATGAIKVELDGRTVLAAPLQSLVDGHLGPPFTYPLVANARQSSGGVYIDVPMPFRTRMRIATANNPRFYHVFYRTFASARGVKTFNPSVRARDVITRLRAAGGRDPKPPSPGARTASASFRVAPGGTVLLAAVRGPGMISALRLQMSRPIRRGVRLLISFDGHRTVDSPLGEFFGSGLGDRPVRALMFAVDRGSLTSWWPMPYRRLARIELLNRSPRTVSGRAVVASNRAKRWAAELSTGRAGYFATSSHAGPTRPGIDWPLLHTSGAGKLVGVSQTMGGANRTYLEGDDIGFVDGSPTPQLHGTGTEDFYDGGWYWNRGPFSDPFNGEPGYEQRTPDCPGACASAYRLMLADSIPFSNSINYGIEHGNRNSIQAIYSSTAYWYERIAR